MWLLVRRKNIGKCLTQNVNTKFGTKSTLKRVKISALSIMTGSRLDHLLMILICNEELDEINIKIRTNKLIKEKESRIATLGLYQFGEFACFSLFIVTA